MSTPDLRAIDELCRLAVVARRLGCRIHLAGADDDLIALIDLAGVGDVLTECPAALAGSDPGPPSRTVPTPGDVP